jgi:PAS domain S-box-containing protein
MWVFDAETLAFLAVNEAAIRHYGYSRGEFLGMTIRHIRPPEEVQNLLQSMREAFRRTAAGRRSSACSGTGRKTAP